MDLTVSRRLIMAKKKAAKKTGMGTGAKIDAGVNKLGGKRPPVAKVAKPGSKPKAGKPGVHKGGSA
jgi:hypothetical protein